MPLNLRTIFNREVKHVIGDRLSHKKLWPENIKRNFLHIDEDSKWWIEKYSKNIESFFMLMASWCTHSTEKSDDKLLAKALESLDYIKFKMKPDILNACFIYHTALVSQIQNMHLDGDEFIGKPGLDERERKEWLRKLITNFCKPSKPGDTVNSPKNLRELQLHLEKYQADIKQSLSLEKEFPKTCS